MGASFNTLSIFREREGTCLAATVAYIEEVLGIEVEDFDVKDLPKEWLELLETEARNSNLLKERGPKKNSISSVIMEDDSE
jgi:hypothetical protein